MKKNIVIIGGGNQAQYTIDILEKENKYRISGIVDSVKDIGSTVYTYPVIGRQEDIKELMLQYNISGVILAIGDNWGRYKVSEQLKELVPDITFVNAIHPSAIVGNDVHIGTGVVAMAGVIINPGAHVGDFTFFATGAQVEHDCVIGDYASVSAGSVMGGHVKIGKWSAITLGCTIFDRVVIGENTVVGGGSLVYKNLPDNILAYGNPAKTIRTREPGEKFLK